MKKLIFIFLLFTGIIFTQDATFFGIEDRVTFDNVVMWVSFDDIIQIDLKNKIVSWDVGLYDAAFNLILSKQLSLDFPSQALPLRNLKDKMKDESATVLGLTYNGQEQ